MNEETKRWQTLEAWLIDHEHDGPFAARHFARGMGCSVEEASLRVQAYLTAQRGVNSTTVFVLKRTGRTRAARWSVGHRTVDARLISNVLFDDIETKIKRAFKPDLDRLREKNPRAARYVEARLVAVTDGALKVLAAALDSAYDEDEE